MLAIDSDQMHLHITGTMVKIPYLAVARFSGEEAGSFLQSQLSADIEALEPGQSAFACYCTPKGQVIGLLLVERTDSGFLAAARRELLPGIVQRLRMFVFRTRVDFDLAGDLCVIGETGPHYHFAETAEAHSSAPASWKAEELRAGICWLGPDTTEKFIPQMLGFDTLGAVSFSKGCYPGQEIVARAKYLGKVKRKPVLARLQGPVLPDAGSKLRLQRGGDWADATMIDAVGLEENDVLLMTVAREEADATVDAVEIDGRIYSCATI